VDTDSLAVKLKRNVLLIEEEDPCAGTASENVDIITEGLALLGYLCHLSCVNTSQLPVL